MPFYFQERRESWDVLNAKTIRRKKYGRAKFVQQNKRALWLSNGYDVFHAQLHDLNLHISPGFARELVGVLGCVQDKEPADLQ